MGEKPIVDAHHVLRHCPRNRTIRDGKTVVGVHPRLFTLRTEINETYLSSSYIEFFDGTAQQQIGAAARAMPLKIGKDDYFVKLNVGTMRALGTKHKLAVKVTHVNSSKKNPAYAMIKGTPKDPSHEWIAAMADAVGSAVIKV
ncbi:hypothetical protein PY650_05925 [Rhizobium calliandrae]|uniref:Uncharacterized protein n=1 Tax=Rhizobium calliandrae TaxID=1312182 RepID=A0ABT7KB56_9HYPH|nr:hypothetical protein [Rhizobium calliandrae]MDL2405198.1 hypothetical protein [Rhizobium calliandrae]